MGNHSTSKNYEVLNQCSKRLSLLQPLLLHSLLPLPYYVQAGPGPYVNVETNAGWTGGDYTGATTDLHVGYEGEVGESASYYVQVGASVVAV